MKQGLLKKIGWNILSIFVAIIFLAPLYIAFTNSFKTQKGLYLNVLGLPKGDTFTLDNYIRAFEDLNFFHSFLNSFLITTISTVLIVIFSSMAAWMLVRSKTKLSKFLFFLFAAAMLIPFQSVMLPLINIMGKLNLLNPVGLVFMYLGFGSSLSIIMYHGFIKNIPLELEEAAIIDGCNKFQVFWIIVFPLLKPITVTVSILNAMWIWNDFLLPQLVINKPEWQTLPLKMFYFFGEYSKKWNLALAGLVLAMIPIIVFYFFAQKHIVKGVTQGSIK
ncbi:MULTISPECIES: carbohydrate ABC transporter permease [Clostridium]|uniref:Sugar ABC transporter, permease protein n=1 Tax=Clostridium novyi (strain NT) TaxID=386415 RepID=A0PXG2_CLONN|nr:MULTISPECIES: carbohydrate ABC transporter permease [Clostridium]ABK60900.1 sugar ABC transporter, permease protein [Clostridium novyi NT]KEH85540.1 sugar ABC transporter permease [Clostridium novyi A str. NCTC 538]KEH87792.1 sugar ABC transporter permease [Clostridium novyi A str. BKT29909]KEH89896.1 sugar ABC transporter permease [Clostridium novyi A str. 4540]KEH95148.1 sugar ABC transporter permease [Clostridium botulinum C/D str. It1]